MNNTPCFGKVINIFKSSQIVEEPLTGKLALVVENERPYLVTSVQYSDTNCSAYQNVNNVNGIKENLSKLNAQQVLFTIPFNTDANAVSGFGITPVDAQHLSKTFFTTGEIYVVTELEYSDYIAAGSIWQFMLYGYELDKAN